VGVWAELDRATDGGFVALAVVSAQSDEFPHRCDLLSAWNTTSVKGRKRPRSSWNNSKVSEEKVHGTPRHLSGTARLLIGIGTRGLSHRENRTPRRSFRLNNVS
jgi:hypothetical protein